LLDHLDEIVIVSAWLANPTLYVLRVLQRAWAFFPLIPDVIEENKNFNVIIVLLISVLLSIEI
jgi:hypothetical protein